MDYVPSPVPNDPEDIPKYLNEELNKIADLLQYVVAKYIEFRNVAPEKPREGMIYGADGTNWNPGAGKGIYAYYGGAWTKL